MKNPLINLSVLGVFLSTLTIICSCTQQNRSVEEKRIQDSVQKKESDEVTQRIWNERDTTRLKIKKCVIIEPIDKYTDESFNVICRVRIKNVGDKTITTIKMGGGIFFEDWEKQKILNDQSIIYEKIPGHSFDYIINLRKGQTTTIEYSEKEEIYHSNIIGVRFSDGSSIVLHSD